MSSVILADAPVTVGLRRHTNEQESSWRWCKKCQGAFYAAARTRGLPLHHLIMTARGYYVVHLVTMRRGNKERAMVRKCQGLFMPVVRPRSVPWDHQTHDGSQSGHYVSSWDMAGNREIGDGKNHQDCFTQVVDHRCARCGGQQAGWRWCQKCHDSFDAGGSSKVCVPGKVADAHQSTHCAAVIGTDAQANRAAEMVPACQGMFMIKHTQPGGGVSVCPADNFPMTEDRCLLRRCWHRRRRATSGLEVVPKYQECFTRAALPRSVPERQVGTTAAGAPIASRHLVMLVVYNGASAHAMPIYQKHCTSMTTSCLNRNSSVDGHDLITSHGDISSLKFSR